MWLTDFLVEVKPCEAEIKVIQQDIGVKNGLFLLTKLGAGVGGFSPICVPNIFWGLYLTGAWNRCSCWGRASRCWMRGHRAGHCWFQHWELASEEFFLYDYSYLLGILLFIEAAHFWIFHELILSNTIPWVFVRMEFLLTNYTRKLCISACSPSSWCDWQIFLLKLNLARLRARLLTFDQVCGWCRRSPLVEVTDRFSCWSLTLRGRDQGY